MNKYNYRNTKFIMTLATLKLKHFLKLV